jgi:hypothetical protein
MKVATILGTRPEIIRLSRVIAALARHMEHVLIHTGQNYDHELNQVFFDDLEIRRPDAIPIRWARATDGFFLWLPPVSDLRDRNMVSNMGHASVNNGIARV